jgi:hypothetical protein
MTSEEIEQTLQIVVRNQSRLSEAQIRFGERQAQIDEALKQVAASQQSLIEHLKVREEGRDVWRGASNEKLAGPVNAQVKYDVRQERLEEAFGQVAESQFMIVQLASVHGDRLDGLDKANIQTDNRFAAMIDAQMQLSHCVHALASNIAILNGCIDRIGSHLDQAVEQIKALATAQTRTDEQIKQMVESSKKSPRKSTRTAKKARPNESQGDSTSLENTSRGEPGA